MRVALAAVMTLCAVVAGWSQSVLAATDTKARPVEFYACNFREGKTRADLDKVTAKFREYANKNDTGYSAWTLTPEYATDAGYDIGWMGSWPDGVAFGVSQEKWHSIGRGLAAEFDQVLDCSQRHVMAMSRPINAATATPEDGILLLYACKLNQGKTLKDAYAAHLQFGQWMKANGSLSVSWMFTPAAGMGDSDVDYYHAAAFYRYSDMGDTMEMYVNRGGAENRAKNIDPVASCQTPTVYDALSVRASDER